MKYRSTKDHSLRVGFEEALLSSLAPDGGLFMPEKIPKFTEAELEQLMGQSNCKGKKFFAPTENMPNFPDIAFMVAKKFIGTAIPEDKLKEICDKAYDFEIPLVPLGNDHFVLELFHGPTLAFKDFAARFMARCVEYFLSQKSQKKTILVATSGDTGGAIGNGFLGLENIKVIILYPKGGVSHVQEQQLTTMGQNITALEIEGNFDDCQRLVKEAFADTSLNTEANLMSANSINVGRIIPQSFYYVWASFQLKAQFPDKKIIFSVPSGNFGNLTGGLLAKEMGAPINHFVAANNANHPFVDYLKTGTFTPVPSVHTISNAMDIGHPNNYYRIIDLFNNDNLAAQKVISGTFFDDKTTAQNVKDIFNDTGYCLCPHTSVAHLGTQEYQNKNTSKDTLYVTVSTAHPAKFVETIEAILQQKIEIPAPLAVSLKKQKNALLTAPNLEALKNILLK